ncbi:hypothetical protein JCM10213_001424 [Rhodosporidiobolus nylandii]
MLDRLPPEILDLVLQLAAPPPSTQLGYSRSSHRTTLRACALVCRRVSGVAQALLWKDLALVGEHDVAKVQQALQDEDNRRRAMGTRAVFVGKSLDLNGLEALLAQLVSLVELRIDGGNAMEKLSVAALTSLSNLRVVDIYSCTFVGDWADVRFPSLVQLHLDTITFWTADARAFPLFRQDAFPSLRALQLRYVCVEDDEDYTAAFPNLPLPFLAQLDMVSLYAGDHAVLSPPVFSSSTAVVLEVSSFYLQNAQRAGIVAALQPHHIALQPVRSFYSTFEAIQQSLSALTRLCSLPTHPSSLHLPSTLLDTLPDATAVRPLEQACDHHGVELLWYDGTSNDLFFHFWQYAKNLKAAQQASGEA